MNWLNTLRIFQSLKPTFVRCLSPISAWCRPVISPGGPHVVVPMRGKLELRCHDNSTVSGPVTRLQWLREKTRRLEGGIEEDGVALVRVSSALRYHMGRYICINNVTQEHSSIFVYVKGGFSGVRRKRKRKQCELVLTWKKTKQKSLKKTKTKRKYFIQTWRYRFSRSWNGLEKSREMRFLCS